MKMGAPQLARFLHSCPLGMWNTGRRHNRLLHRRDDLLSLRPEAWIFISRLPHPGRVAKTGWRNRSAWEVFLPTVVLPEGPRRRGRFCSVDWYA